MKRRLWIALACGAGLCLAQSPPPEAKKEATKEVSLEEVGRLLAEEPHKVFFLDVRSPDEIAKLGSLSGYVNIPLDQLEKRLSEVPKDKLVITA